MTGSRGKNQHDQKGKSGPRAAGFSLPQSRLLRIAAGILLVLMGLLGFLPVLGFWMIPLGVAVLSVDLPAVRRFKRKAVVTWSRWRGR